MGQNFGIFRVLAFERPSTADSIMIVDLCLTSPDPHFVDHIKRERQGQFLLCEQNVTLQHSPTRLRINSLVPGWKLTKISSFRKILRKTELQEAERCPHKFCMSTFILQSNRKDVVKKADVIVQLKMAGKQKSPQG
eukprot:m.33493 g.33493  ORF g.33493 m.33493 type:complete len:136 (+) comp31825_c0_seq1:229-636(+)